MPDVSEKSGSNRVGRWLPTRRVKIWSFAVYAVVAATGLGWSIVRDVDFSDHGQDTRAAAISDATTTPSRTRSPGSTTTALRPDYQGVAVPARGVVYDVPATWIVDGPSTIRGYENEAGSHVVGTGTATEGEDYCGSSNRANSFVVRSDLADTAAAATDLGTLTAEAAYDSRWGTEVATPEPFTASGGLSGHLIEIAGPAQADDPACTATEFVVHAFAFPGPQGTLVLVVGADRGVAGELTAEQAREIVASVRLL